MPQDAAEERWQREIAPHLGTAWRLARWLLSSGAEAEDAVQEACLRAWQAGRRGVAPEDGRAWLLAIQRNVCWTRLRGAARQASRLVPFDDALREMDRAAAGQDAEAALGARQRAARLRQAIAALPPPFREVVVLRDLEGMSHAETAAVLGLPVGTVMSRLARARQKLRAALEGSVDARAGT